LVLHQYIAPQNHIHSTGQGQFDLAFFNAYMDVINARADLMEDYAAKLAETDAMKNALSP
jgi:hypothetical protein